MFLSKSNTEIKNLICSLLIPMARNGSSSKMLAKCAIVILFWSTSINGDGQPKIPRKDPLYVFGDSMYDTGTALYVKHGPAANSNPYGMTYFKKPAGRFSNGLLIPDFIAQFAGLPFPIPYKNPKLKDYTQAVNFADAAAGVLVETRPTTLNLKLQTESYVEMTQKLEQKYGKAQTKKLLSKAVYLFNIGANDYTDLYNKNKKPLSTPLITQFKDKVLDHLSIHLTTMYKKGARKFAFQASGPMGCLPSFRHSDGSCTEELNRIARIHNAGLKVLCKKLARKLPGFKYSIYDFYSALSARLNNGPSYGFKESRVACCGSGIYNGHFSCGDKKEGFKVCHDPNTYLWFDAGHPSQKADQQFAQEFWSGSSNVVVPRNIKSFFRKNFS